MLYPLYDYYLESALSLDEIVADYIHNFYLLKHSQQKVEKIRSAFQKSKLVNRVHAIALQSGRVPSYIDYLEAINGTPWFMLQSNSTQALGVLMAMQEWDNEFNKVIHRCDSEQIRNNALRVFQKWQIYGEMTTEQYNLMRTKGNPI